MGKRLVCMRSWALMAVIAVSVLSLPLVIAEEGISLHALQQNLLKLSGLRALVDLELVLTINVGGRVERHVTILAGQLLDAEAPFDVDVALPLDWSITGVASNGAVLLDLAGKLTADGGRWQKAYLDETRLGVEFEKPVVSFLLRASRIQLVLEGDTIIREFQAQMSFDLDGDGAYEEAQTANVTSIDGVFTCRSRVLVTTSRQIPFLVKVLHENGTLPSLVLEGLIHLEESGGSISGTLNSTTWESFPSLKAELNYYVGTISIELRNDIFKAKEGEPLSEQVETAAILFIHGFAVLKPCRLTVKVFEGVEGQQPLPEANVTVKLEERVIARATTDSNGTVVFELAPAKYNITTEKAGYVSNSTGVDLKAEEAESIIVLKRIPSWLDVAADTLKKNLVWIALTAIVALVLYAIYKRGGG